MKNAIAWFEIPVTDFDRAKKFYSTLVGKELQEMPIGEGMRYAMFPVDDPQGIGGAISYVPGDMTPAKVGTLVYLNGGDDLSPMLSRAEAAGGRVVRPKTEISSEFGYYAIFEDTEGNLIGLHSMK